MRYATGWKAMALLTVGVITLCGADAGMQGEGLAAVGVAAVDAHRTLTIARERGLRTAPHAVKIGGVRFELE